MKRLKLHLTLFALLLGFLPVWAVTDKEMEQARTITALCYLRYANNGSGYLDEIRPQTMGELEKKLKAKEKENLRTFKAVAVPKDYASWDKAKLVEYWGTIFFNSPGLISDGKAARSRVRSRVGAMKVEAPRPQEEKAPEKAVVEKPTGEPAAEAAPASASAGADAQTDATAAEMQRLAQREQRADSLAAAEVASEPEPVKQQSSSTWIYILILCVLVAAVIALVVYASNVMKRRNSDVGEDEHHERSLLADEAELERMREKFSSALNNKNREIETLSRRAEGEAAKAEEERLRAESLARKVEDMKLEIASLREENARLRTSAREAAPRAEVDAPVAASAAQIKRPASKPRTIYLGRVNSRGIFVRADRNFNPVHDVYCLETSDGLSGTFYVADDPTLAEVAILDASQMLEGGCSGVDFNETEGSSRIITRAPGTAIFESGCWRVSRKARIRFE